MEGHIKYNLLRHKTRRRLRFVKLKGNYKTRPVDARGISLSSQMLIEHRSGKVYHTITIKDYVLETVQWHDCGNIKYGMVERNLRELLCQGRKNKSDTKCVAHCVCAHQKSLSVEIGNRKYVLRCPYWVLQKHK